eukprot:2612805-Rhodomonas_salina.1
MLQHNSDMRAPTQLGCACGAACSYPRPPPSNDPMSSLTLMARSGGVAKEGHLPCLHRTLSFDAQFRPNTHFDKNRNMHGIQTRAPTNTNITPLDQSQARVNNPMQDRVRRVPKCGGSFRVQGGGFASGSGGGLG